AVLLVLSSGCATPSTSESRNVPVDTEDWGGIQSVDIRTVASTMSVELLSTPEIAGHEGRVNVAIEPMVNSTRFIFDKDIFTEKLRLELMKVAKDKISFQANLGQKTRIDRQHLVDEKQLDKTLDSIAETLAKTPLISEAKEPLKFAVIPVTNTNIIGMNAESVTALLRSKMLEKSAGKIQFLARDKNGKSIDQVLNEKDLKGAGLVKGGKYKEMYGVDYFVGGEFIAKSLETAIKREGGEIPNLDKYFNVMLIDAETGGVAFEKSVKIENKVDSGVDRTDYILTGELKGLSNVANRGDRSDYILISLQLIDPQSNNIVWTNGYEVKRMTKVSNLYK
ncbi:MAG: hypothetical protein NT118_02450, partial [Lentisphaerae bacterium]|nr:hypothetical protein [Lentisphaerota bacterium]